MVKALREATGAGVLDCKKALEATGGDWDEAVVNLRQKGLAVAAKKASREANDGMVSVLVDDAGRGGTIVEVNCETDFVARTDGFQKFVRTIAEQVAQDASVQDVPALLSCPFIEDKSSTVSQRLTQIVAELGENIVLRRFARVEREEDGWVEGYIHPGSRLGVILHVSAGSKEVATGAAFRELVHDLALQVAAAAPRCISPDEIPTADVEAERAILQAQIADDKKPDHIKERIVSGRLEKWYAQVCLLHQPFVKDGSVKVGDLVRQKSQQWDTPLAVERFVRYQVGEDD